LCVWVFVLVRVCVFVAESVGTLTRTRGSGRPHQLASGSA
jgi:hypothetical protein